MIFVAALFGHFAGRSADVRRVADNCSMAKKDKGPDSRDEDELRKLAEFFDREAAGEIVIRPPLRKRSDYSYVEVPKALLPKIRRLVAEYESKGQ